MPGKIAVVVEDLIFLSRILETARRLDLSVENLDPARLEENLTREVPRAVILDMNHRSGRALQLLSSLKRNPATRQVPVVAFLSHVQSDLAGAAREAGCDQLLARSAFSQRLPQLLLSLSGRDS